MNSEKFFVSILTYSQMLTLCSRFQLANRRGSGGSARTTHTDHHAYSHDLDDTVREDKVNSTNGVDASGN